MHKHMDLYGSHFRSGQMFAVFFGRFGTHTSLEVQLEVAFCYFSGWPFVFEALWRVKILLRLTPPSVWQQREREKMFGIKSTEHPSSVNASLSVHSQEARKLSQCVASVRLCLVFISALELLCVGGVISAFCNKYNCILILRMLVFIY